MAGEDSAVAPQYHSGLMVPSLMGEDDAEAAYQKTHAETVKKTTLINLDETRSPTSLVTPTMNGNEQIKEVNPYAGHNKPRYLDQVHKTQMYYEQAEQKNTTARLAKQPVAPKPTPKTMPDNDFKNLIGGQYQTDWVEQQQKSINKKKKGKRPTKAANPGMGLFRSNSDDSR
eukprot:m.82177 g.82177  ORF g.82177 m.82177 type:complete len:172 (-) comp11069_c0_seq2:2300-2815(-)